ncbi:MAG: FAD-binding oxidoreductase, partial [Acidimicrobiia bacterium]
MEPAHVLTGDGISEDYTHDEALTVPGRRPAFVVRPETSAQVAEVLRIANEHGVPVTARGTGTGLSGACVPRADAIVVSFERMNRVLEIDTENHVAVVQPGVTLDQLDEVTAAHDLIYPVFPGEYSASLGGNVATNAGGMRAVKYGVTRHQVLGLEAVLATGEVIRTGGKFVKATTGYDLTQLIIGSEGTLALVTEATLKLYPRLRHQATLLAPFTTLDEVTAAIPRIVDSGIGPLILEYIDMITLSAVTAYVGLDLGIPKEIQDTALAYLVVMMENGHEDRLEEDVGLLAEQLAELGAIDVYVLPSGAAAQLIDAREKTFWVAK